MSVSVTLMRYNGEKIGSSILRHGQGAKIKSACKCSMYPMGFQGFCTHRSWNSHHQFITHNDCWISHTYKATDVLSTLLFTCPIRWRASQVQIFLLQRANFDRQITPKKMKPWRLPKIEGCIVKCRVPRLWLTYIVERRTTFAKAYGIKAGLLRSGKPHF